MRLFIPMATEAVEFSTYEQFIIEKCTIQALNAIEFH